MRRFTISGNPPPTPGKWRGSFKFSMLSLASFLGGRRWGPAHDDWLRPWLPLLHQSVGEGVIFELGCGNGTDLAMLAAEGLRVMGLDRSPAAIAEAGKKISPQLLHCQDLRDPFPPAARGASAVIASLSLHYFSVDQTGDVMLRIRECLAPGGIFLCRVNSTKDVHFGAVGHRPVAENQYLVHGQLKRFFDGAAARSLCGEGWDVLSVEEKTIQRYALPKVVWEIAARRTGSIPVPDGSAGWQGECRGDCGQSAC